MIAAKVALRPENGAPRQPAMAVRGTTNYFNSSDDEHSTSEARVQRLTALCGVSGPRAELIAFLIWGEAPHA